MAAAPPFVRKDRAAPLGWRLLIGCAHLLAALLIGLLWSPLLCILYVIIVAIFIGWKNRARILGQGRRQRLKFTSEGKYAVGIAIGVGIAAINTGNNLLYLFLGMILSLIVISGVLSELTLKGLKVERLLPQRLFAGQAFLTTIRIRNTKIRLPSFSVQIEDLSDGLKRTKKCFFLKVRAGRSQETGYRAEFSRRGQYVFKEIHLVTRFPFSFFIKRRIISSQASVIVFPRIHSVPEITEAHDDAGDVHPVSKKGLGREFFGLRDYRPGDDARDIHWARSAGRENAIVREFAVEGAPSVSIGLNTYLRPTTPIDEQAHCEAVDRCVDYAASLVVHYLDQGHDVEFCTPESRWVATSGGRGLDAILRALATITFDSPDPDEIVGWVSNPHIVVTHALGDTFLPSHDLVKVITP